MMIGMWGLEYFRPRMAHESTLQLQYAGARDGRRVGLRRWVIRAVLVGAIILAVRLGVLGWAHASLIYYQRECLAHRATGTEVIYQGTGGSSVAAADWEKFYARFSPPGSRHAATAFVGELKREGGKPRLVAVEISERSGPLEDLRGLKLITTVIEPGWAWGRPKLISDRAWIEPRWDDRNYEPPVVYAGVRDPENQAHFTITIQRGDVKRIVDGYLQADDRVTLEVREAWRSGTAMGN